MLTVDEMAAILGITPQRVKIWNRHGLLRGHACNDKNEFETKSDVPRLGESVIDARKLL